MDFFETTDHRIVVSKVPPDSILCKHGIEVGDVLIGPSTRTKQTHFKYLDDRLKDASSYPQTLYIDKHPLLPNGFPFKTALYEVRTYYLTNTSPEFMRPPINSSHFAAAVFCQAFAGGTTFGGRDVGNSGQ